MHWIPVLVAVAVLGGAGVAWAEGGFSHPFLLEFGKYGLGDDGVLAGPQGVAVDSEGNVFVGDTGNRRIQKFDSNGTFLTSWGQSGSGEGMFSIIGDIAILDDYLFVTDSDLHRVQKFDLDGGFLAEWGSKGGASSQFLGPSGIAGGANGTIHIVDTGNQRVQVFDINGTYLYEWGESGPEDGDFVLPREISSDGDDGFYLSDGGIIKRFDADGKFLGKIDGNVGGRSVDLLGTAVDSEGMIYAADGANSRVIRFSPDGTSLAIWGNAGIGDSKFTRPVSVALGPYGDLYVADADAHRIQKFGTPTSLDPDLMTNSSKGAETKSAPEATQDDVADSKVVQESPPAANVPRLVASDDIIQPVVVAPPDIRTRATGLLTPVDTGRATASDESGILSLESNAPERFTLGSHTVIWTATDIAGNFGTATQIVSIFDDVPPVIPPLRDILVESGESDHVVIEIKPPAATDDIMISSVTGDIPERFPIGTSTITWTATDIAGNAAVGVQTVVVADTAMPRITAPEDIVAEAVSADSNRIILGSAEATDNAGYPAVYHDAPDAFPLGNTTVSWTATDSWNNTATDTQTVMITDTTPPVISPPPDIIFEVREYSPAVLKRPDVHDIQEVSLEHDARPLHGVGEMIVIWTATDASGNVATASQNVRVQDTIPPEIQVPEDIVVPAGGSAGTAVDIGRAEATDPSGILDITNDAPEMFPIGETLITWTASDNHGNTQSATQSVKIYDDEPPLLLVAPEVVLDAAGPHGAAAVLDAPVADDASDIASIVSDAPEVFPLGSTTILWRVTDAAGNSAEASQTVTVIDRIPPEISAPADMVVEAESESSPVRTGIATAGDNAGPVTVSSDAPDLFLLGTTTITWTATDIAGNTAADVQLVTVQDTTPPLIMAPEDIIAEASGDMTGDIKIGAAAATDALGAPRITHDAPESFELGTTAVTWTATDGSGNSAEAVQQITIHDTTPPEILAPPGIIIEAESALGTAAELGIPDTSDAVGDIIIRNNAPEKFPVGTTQVVWVAIDDAGNRAEAVQEITVRDTIIPGIVAPADIVAEAADASGNTVDIGEAVAADTAGSVDVTHNAPSVFPIGTTEVLWRAVDEAGNAAEAVQRITVHDTVPPRLAAPSDILYEASSADQNRISLGVPEATDAVGVKDIVHDAPDLFSVGETPVRWTATDAAGNLAEEIQIITVIDTAPPILDAPPDVIFEAAGTETVLDTGEAEAVDLVGVEYIVHDAPAAFLLGTTMITWTAADHAGNIATALQNVTVVDTAAPLIEVPADIVVNATMPEMRLDIGAAIISDAVDGFPALEHDAPAVFPLGSTTVSWRGTDATGNSASVTQQVVVLACGNPYQSYNLILATDGAGVIAGTPDDDLIFASDGDDIVTGAGGDDCIIGGGGRDILIGGSGNDVIYGGDGDDIIRGLDGDDTLEGGFGADILDGGSGTDSCGTRNFGDSATGCQS